MTLNRHASVWLWSLLTLASAGFAASETTPTELPHAETFIYREHATEPLRLFVVKPKHWNAGDRQPALIFFFGGGWTTGTPRNSIGWCPG